MTTRIKVSGLGKCYHLRRAAAHKARYRRLSEELVAFARNPLASLRQRRQGTEEFWALKDVDFEINDGEVVGVIGRNGAGKSTLLKLLSQITEPSRGRIELNGRVASLLEVGTGFHPELTGRENIFLNGAILGMSREEIRRKFDEIVAFAEVERFLDTPVKRYSSGMYVRLAFAVAAHLEPEILIVDEVLAVGDKAFQEKCLGKIDQVARGGRTVLFVSHNMSVLRSLCSRGILLDSGGVSFTGTADAAVAEYLAQTKARKVSHRISAAQHVRGEGNVELTRARMLNLEGAISSEFLIGEPFELELKYTSKNRSSGTAWCMVKSEDGVVVSSSLMRDNHDAVTLVGDGGFAVRFNGLELLPGHYRVSAGVFSNANVMEDWCEDVATFEVLAGFFDGRPFDHRLGKISIQLPWRHAA